MFSLRRRPLLKVLRGKAFRADPSSLGILWIDYYGQSSPLAMRQRLSMSGRDFFPLISLGFPFAVVSHRLEEKTIVRRGSLFSPTTFKGHSRLTLWNEVLPLLFLWDDCSSQWGKGTREPEFMSYTIVDSSSNIDENIWDQYLHLSLTPASGEFLPLLSSIS